MRIRKIAPLLALALLGSAACEEDIFAPSTDQVAGTYVLTTLIVRQGTATSDLIAEGVTTTITLSPEGTTSGSLFIPASVNIDGVDIYSDVVGTWSLKEDKIRFDHEPTTYLTDVEWTYQPEGDITVGDADNWIEATLAGLAGQ